MAVFYDTGGGDIYGGPDRATILGAMQKDGGDDYDFDADMFEVSPNTPMRTEDGSKHTIAQEYGDRKDAFCVASENC